MKQNPAWRVKYRGGISQWTAPTGHSYTSWPHDWRDPGPPDDPHHLNDLHLDELPVQDPPPEFEPRFCRPELTHQQKIELITHDLQQDQLLRPPDEEPSPDETQPDETAPDDVLLGEGNPELGDGQTTRKAA